MLHFNTASYLENLQTAAQRRFDSRNVSNWAAWRDDFRAALEQALGLPLIRAGAEALPLSPRREEWTEFGSYTREKLTVETEPGIRIPFYLLLPKSASRALPLVICPHGHGQRGKESSVGNTENEAEAQEAVENGRDIALQAVERGYAALAPDVRGFWEMARPEDQGSRANNSCADLQRKALLYGRTLLGERVHDLGRLLDYAITRDEIDTSQVVATGNSGGGTVTLFAAALDERITLAAPSCYFCTFFDSIVSIHHCPCNIVPGVMNLGEMYDVAGLIAPRPVLMMSGATDPIFPIEATREAFEYLKAIYARQGVQDKCELFVGAGGHRYDNARIWDFVHEQLGAIPASRRGP